MGAPVDVDQRAARLPGGHSTAGLKRAAGQPRSRPRPFSCAWEILVRFQEVYCAVVPGPSPLASFRGFSAPWSITANSLSPEAALPSARATSQTARLRASPLASRVGMGFDTAMSHQTHRRFPGESSPDDQAERTARATRATRPRWRPGRIFLSMPGTRGSQGSMSRHHDRSRIPAPSGRAPSLDSKTSRR